MNINLQELKLVIIGLGYVGLPLAVEFGKKRDVIGFDVDIERINQLENFHDSTLEVSTKDIQNAKKLKFAHQVDQISDCNCFIVTVPTPIDKNKKPDLSPIQNASEMISKILKKNDLVIYESTVYPGATEEFCVPILEADSGLKFNRDFFCGYSPERINPGDKDHRLPNITKVTSGSTEDVANLVDNLYKEIVTVGTHKAESIKVAEAAKVIENTQRDLNIALINELAVIFNQMEIDTEAVLEAAGSKWNFLPFKPGLVGGHCIGVDPYYLTYKAQSIGYEPEVILAGRRLNDSMGIYIVDRLIKLMAYRKVDINGSKALIMGVTFKENCPDLRNSKVLDIINELKSKNIKVDIHDPWVDAEKAKESCGLKLISDLNVASYDAVLLTVAHDQYKNMKPEEIKALIKDNGILYDLKSILPKTFSDLRL
tara:strand:- start:1309 stop:2589 length:1281 start_codon:yes stop_codon:yes gene_type:complete